MVKPISDKDIIKEIDSVATGEVIIFKKDGKRDSVKTSPIKKPWDFEE